MIAEYVKSGLNLTSRKGLVLGLANEHSIAYGCAQAMREAGAELAVTWRNERTQAHARPLAERLGCALAMPCDVEQPGELEAVFDAIRGRWGRLDFAVHCIGAAPLADLHGRVVDCSREGFLHAMDVSVHSFIRLARLAEPLMDRGGCLLTMSYLGADEVVPEYRVMGPVKAALEAAARYLAAELGPSGIRVHPISPGPLPTRAASGITGFDELARTAAAKAPLRRLASIEDVGALAVFLASDAARSMTGCTVHVDAGYHIVD
ncbi:MAG: enoyl-ACP reductase FabI [Pseudomonadota bacterium]